MSIKIKFCYPHIKLLAFNTDAVLPAINTCYDLSDCDESRIPRVISSSGHLSVLRHGFASVKIMGISRATGRQILRKGHADYLEKSQRYVDVRNAAFSIPKKIVSNPEYIKKYTQALRKSLETYAWLRNNGVTKEDARDVLPQSIETTITMSGNLQMWWDFFNLRIDGKVQEQCRIVAVLILNAFCGKSDIFKIHPKINDNHYLRHISEIDALC